ncbi:photosystem II biogenesis protein Psp29 [Sodalinema gerasimenkoae]|uniref:photosystem II biogenesis protein Psp29 n=1 Tax=Sodalinema gerasimenkoae TaxID=2862348 RepID=UPI00135C28FA|nr:photosystem II biogenesis protein Psp29 [Sodalinema gerasimenkoae]
MDNVRTVSDTKRDFYQTHTRPINSLYRRVVEEMMVEMHLLSVNVDFTYNPVYALGVVSAFDRFMNGYRPEADVNSIFTALCRATGGDPEQYRRDAASIREAAAQLSQADLLALASEGNITSGDNAFGQQMAQFARGEGFKYCRLLAIGLLSAIEAVDGELLSRDKELADLLNQLGATLNVSDEKLRKDLELYRSNLEKMEQAQSVMADILEADRKKRAEREAEREAKRKADQAKQAAAPDSPEKSESESSS